MSAAREALLTHQVQLQVLVEIGEWAVAGADRHGYPGELVLVDEAEPGHGLGEVRPAVNQDRAAVVASLQLGDRGAQVAAEDLGRAPVRALQGVGEDRLGLLVHERRYR